MDLPLQQALADAVQFFEREKVAYALIGGLAVSFRGEPRVTADVDLVIAADVPEALRLVQKLKGSPFDPLFSGVEEVVERAFILPLRHRATGIKVDTAIGLSGFERQAIQRAEPIDLGGTSISVATTEDLLLMKLLASRPRDDEDIQGLLAARGDEIDWEYCRQTATQLGDALGIDLAARLNLLRKFDRPDSVDE